VADCSTYALLRNCENYLPLFLGKWPTWSTILFYVFISILYTFRATSWSSSGESIVSMQPLVYVTLCRWPFRVQVGKELSDLHTKRSPTQSAIYQRLYWYNWFSWWCARGCSKHVENWNKYIEKNCASSWSFTKFISELERFVYRDISLCYSLTTKHHFLCDTPWQD